MLRATPDVLRVLRHRYEETDQLLASIATEFGIGLRTLGRMREVEGWRKRSDRLKELPKAVQLLEEVEALAKASEATRAPASGKPEEELGPRFRGDERSEISPPAEIHEQPVTSPPTLPFSGRGSAQSAALPLSDGGVASAIDRLEALVLKEIAAAETARERVTDKRQLDKVSETSARTLATLTQTLRTLQQMRTGKPIDTRTADHDDQRDDMPTDLDEFRIALAQRIEALFASETDVAGAEANSGRADTGAPE